MISTMTTMGAMVGMTILKMRRILPAPSTMAASSSSLLTAVMAARKRIAPLPKSFQMAVPIRMGRIQPSSSKKLMGDPPKLVMILLTSPLVGCSSWLKIPYTMTQESRLGR